MYPRLQALMNAHPLAELDGETASVVLRDGPRA
jgi:hypothetical protein